MWADSAEYLIQVVHARADEEGLQAAVLTQQDIRVRPVHTNMQKLNQVKTRIEGH